MSHERREARPLVRFVRAQFAADLRNVTHDSLLAFVVLLPILLALLYRFVLPGPEEMVRLVETGLPQGLEPYRGFLVRFAGGFGTVMMSLFVGITPGTVGSVYGLLLVEERDTRTLAAVRVTPLPFTRYMTARMLAPCALSVLSVVVAYPVAGLAPLPLGVVSLIALAGAIMAPAVALFIVAFAANEVTGLVLMRVATVALALPIVAYFVPGFEPFVWPVPSYWQMKALWLAAAGDPYGGVLLVVPVLTVPLTLWLYRRFDRRQER